MGRTIRIDDEVFAALQQRAQPLVDNPNTVLRRFLGLDVVPGRPDGWRAEGPRTSITDMELPLLRVLAEMGGSPARREAMKRLGGLLADRLTDVDKSKYRERPRWMAQADHTRLFLARKGDMDGDAPHGVWRITDQGRQRVADSKDTEPDSAGSE